MSKAKFIVRVAMCVALLIGGQLALSGVPSVEIVTVILLCFCYCYGIRHGIAVATTFSLLRCFVFGFQVQIILLYLIYYNFFALFFGWLGKRFAGETTFWKTIVVGLCAVIFTALFSMLDNVIYVAMFLPNANAAKVYFLQSVPVMTGQMICAAATVGICFVPLTQVIKKFDK